MDSLEVTRLSSKGQVVLPQAIRRRMHLSEGAKFVIFGSEDTIILKKLEVPSPQHVKQLLKASQAYAKEAGLTPSHVKSAIRLVRSRHSR